MIKVEGQKVEISGNGLEVATNLSQVAYGFAEMLNDEDFSREEIETIVNEQIKFGLDEYFSAKENGNKSATITPEQQRIKDVTNMLKNIIKED